MKLADVACRRLAGPVFFALVLCSGPRLAWSASRAPMAIASQPVAPALNRFARERGLQVVYLSSITRDRVSPGAPAGLSLSETLERLLDGTGLQYEFINARSVRIVESGSNAMRNGASAHPIRISYGRAESAERESFLDSQARNEPESATIVRSDTASEQADAVDSVALDEIVVTARKLAENLFSVPLPITVFTAKHLEQAGIQDMDDVAMATPGLNFISVLGEGLPTPVIRGVAPNSISAESSASIFVDGVYISGREGLNFSELDLERIEVVKGPQSALYGRNSFSGAINFVTAVPTPEWSNRVELVAGNNSKYAGKLLISGPLIEDRLGIRVAYGHDESGGTYENLQSGGPDVGGLDIDTVQTRLRYTPTNSLTLDATGYYSKDRFDPAAAYSFLPNCENANLLTGTTGIRYRQYCGEVLKKQGSGLRVNTLATGQDRVVTRFAGSITWQSQAGTLSSVTSYSDVKFTGATDYLADRGNEGLALLYTTTFGATSVFRTGQIVANPTGNKTHEFSQQLRFASPEELRVRATVGTYFYDNVRRTATQNFYNSEPLPADFASFVLGAGFLGFFVNNPSPPVQRLETARSIAGFTAIEGDLTKDLTIRVEARYSADDKGFVNYTDNRPLSRSDTHTWGQLTWRGNVSYHPSERTMIYGGVARGEKGGDFYAGTDNAAPGRPAYVLPYDNEKIFAYELGLKGHYLDNRLALDLSGYYYDWRDMVLFTALTGAPGLPAFVSPEIFFYANSGDTEIRGIEAAAQYKLTKRLVLSASASWTDATIVKNAKSVRPLFRTFPSLAPNGDVGGNEAQRQSKLQGALTMSYTRPLIGSLSMLARGDLNYKGKQFVDETNLAWIGPRTVVNARLGLVTDRYSVELWGQNLLNDRTPNSVIGQTFIGNTEMQQDGSYRFDGLNTLNARRFDMTLNPLRQFGLTFKYEF